MVWSNSDTVQILYLNRMCYEVYGGRFWKLYLWRFEEETTSGLLLSERIDTICISQCSPDKQNIYQQIIIGIGLRDNGGWEILPSAVYKLENQERSWCNAVCISGPMNQEGWCPRAGEAGCLSPNREWILPFLAFLFYSGHHWTDDATSIPKSDQYMDPNADLFPESPSPAYCNIRNNVLSMRHLLAQSSWHTKKLTIAQHYCKQRNKPCSFQWTFTDTQ